MRRGFRHRLNAGAAAAGAAAAAVAFAAGPALADVFSYQGELSQAGTPVTDLCDFRFTLFDAASGGTQVGTTEELLAVPVVSGRITADLDFGSTFDGADYWVEIEVRCPAGAGSYTTLTPRQKITPVPYAHYAMNANTPFSYVGTDAVFNGGNVGIGTNNPEERFQVEDNFYIDTSVGFTGVNRNSRVTTSEHFGIQAPGTGYGGMYIRTADTAGLPFYGYDTSGTARAWTYLDGSTGSWHVYNDGLSFTVTDTGRIGIGTSNPQEKLHVFGGTDTSAAAGGYVVLGSTTAENVSIDNNEIMARRNGGIAPLTLNHEGGNVNVSAVGSGRLGVGTSNPQARLHVKGSGNEVMVGEEASHRVLIDGDTGSGTQIDMYNDSGIRTLILDSHGGAEDAELLIYNGDGTLRAEIDGNINGGGFIQLMNSNAADSIELFANEGTTHGAAMYMYNLAGARTIEIDADINGTGRVITQELQITGGADLSEQFDVTGDVEAEPGMVLCIDPQAAGELGVSSTAYDRTVAGVVAGAGGVKPGLLMAQNGVSEVDGRYPVALTGRVYVRCTTENGAIAPGDLLTTSDLPGHAMKADDFSRAPGAIIGKAMSSLDSGEGLVLVLVSLQ